MKKVFTISVMFICLISGVWGQSRSSNPKKNATSSVKGNRKKAVSIPKQSNTNPIGKYDVSGTLAKHVANLFYESNQPLASGKVKGDAATVINYRAEVVSGDTLWYLFKFEDNGFVIVSGDKRTKAILGYNLGKGGEDIFAKNPTFEYWMDQYEMEILEVRKTLDLPSQEIREMWDYYDSHSQNNSTGTQKAMNYPYNPVTPFTVSPMTATDWDQDYPYNALCPTNTYVGCVAVAIGQIMRYHGHPTTGVGSHSYYHSTYGTQSANFGATTYDYGAMPNSVSSYNYEVARLLYHCGVAVDMDYGVNGSGSNGINANQAFQSYFDYTTTGLLYRSSYTATSWQNMLTNALDAGNPIYYAGYPSSGIGHAWVCDGYNASFNFSMNWGWSGSYNGFFPLSSLTPGGFVFTYNQQVIIPVPNTPNGSNCQCAFSNNQYPSGVLTPTNNWQIMNCQYAGEYSAYDVISGNDYEWSYCPSDGGNSPFDDRINLFTASGTYIDCVTDYCGLSAKVFWTATYTGVVYIQTNEYIAGSPCSTNSNCADLAYRTTSSSPIPVSCSGNSNLTACSGNFSDGSGNNDYGDNSNCSWLIQPTNASSITLSFSQFDTESGFDFVTIYDGSNSNAPILGSFSGSSLPSPVTTTGGSMFVDFSSDGSVTAPGWSVSYSCTSCSAPNAPIINASATSICNGQSATLSVTPCAGCSVSWSNGQTGNSISVANAGTYTATVTNACGNATSQPVTITSGSAPNAPIINASTTSICNGQSATLSVTPCAGCSVSWSNGQTGNSISVANAGTYTATVTNACGNATSQPVTITSGSAPNAPIINASTTSICNGQSATLSVTPCAGCSVSWSNGQTGNSISVANAGTYTATVTNACGNATSQPVTITSGSAPNAPIINASATSICNGQSATLSVTPCAGCSVSWSNGQTGNSISVANAGTYTATVTNACGNATSQPVTITSGSAPNAPIINASTTSICNGQSATLSVTPCAGCSVSWSNGQTGNSISVANAGTYTATVTNACGNATSQPVTITSGSAPNAPIINASATSICNGQSATLSVTPCAGCSVSWSNGQTGNSISVANAGTYTATVTNACGNATSQPVTITSGSAPNAPIINASATSICNGQSATLSVTPCAGCSVSWSNGQTGNSISVANAGTYTATVTNACGNATSQPVTITSGSAPNAPIINASATSICNGQSATLSVTPCAGCSVSWSNGQTGNSISVANAGTYTATVTNACGNATSQPVTITSGSAPNAPIINASATSICNGQSATLSVTPCAGCSVSWSNGQTGNSISVANAGTYTATVTNACGNATSQPVTITSGSAPNAPIINASATSICNGQSATLSVTPCAGCSVSWSNGQTGNSISVANAGTYTATVTNACGNATSQPVTITSGSAPNAPIISVSNDTICNGQMTALTVQNQCSGCSILYYDSNNNLVNSPVGAGDYYATMTNLCGTTFSPWITVVELNAPIPVQITASSLSTCGTPITLTCMNCSPQNINQWSQGGNSGSLTVNNSGAYWMTSTNECGMAMSNVLNINIFPPPITPQINIIGVCSLEVNNPVWGVNYEWSLNNNLLGQTGTNISTVFGGSYTVTAIDPNGCNSTSLPITMNPCATDIHEDITARIVIYPNPFQNNFIVQLPFETLNILPLELFVYDATGREVVQKTLISTQSQIEINTETWSKGIYLLKLNISGNIYTQKLIAE